MTIDPQASTPPVDRLLIDSTLAATIEDVGFAKRPLLEPADVAQLLAGYRTLVQPGDSGLVVDYMRRDRSLVRRMSDVLMPVWDRRLPGVLEDFQVAMTTFVVKHPGEDSLMFLHDDRTFVDGDQNGSLTFWVPLVDVGRNVPNGGLEVVPRSHRLRTGLSGSNTPDLIRPFEDYFRSLLTRLEVSAGEAVIYHSRLLHASGPNLTAFPRIAAVCSVARRDAQLVHVVATGRRHRRVHAVDPEFFLDHHPRDIEVQMPSDRPVLREFDDNRLLDAADVARVLRTHLVPDYVPPIPDGLVGGADAGTGRIIVTSCSGPQRSVDLELNASNFERTDAHTPLLRLEPLDPGTGGAVSVALRRRFRPCRTPHGVRSHLGWSSSRINPQVDLLILDPGGRALTRPTCGRLWVTELAVIEAPAVGAGARCGQSVVALAPTQAYALPADEEVALWNDGPGQLIATVNINLRWPPHRLSIRALAPLAQKIKRRLTTVSL